MAIPNIPLKINYACGFDKSQHVIPFVSRIHMKIIRLRNIDGNPPVDRMEFAGCIYRTEVEFLLKRI